MKTVEVIARRWWNDTGIDVAAGETLGFAASGAWIDLNYSSDAGGYDPPRWMHLFEGIRRHPRGRWFELTGCIGRRRFGGFSIGNRAQVRMPAAGRLYLYANDVPGFYRNNRDALRVTVTRIAGTAS